MNIALVNELKRVYGAMGIEVWDVIEAAKPKPFGYMPFYPGLGLGGHSIPIDPLLPYLEGAGVWHRHALYRAWRPVNSSMAQHVVNEPARILDLSSSARGLTRARILVLAVA